MTAGWCSRTLRAAVFAAVCVLLAALGHVMMSGSAVPAWVLAAGLAATGAAGWCLAGRERGLPLIVTVVVAAQTALHSAFSLTRSATDGADSMGMASMGMDHRGMAPMGMAPMGMAPMDMAHMDTVHMDTAHMGTVHTSMDHMDTVHTSMDHMDTVHTSMAHMGMSSMDMGAMAHMGRSVGGSWSFGMLTAHLLAALLCGLWLAYGERAAFRILRALAARLTEPLRLLLALPATPDRPRVRARRRRSQRAPRLRLVHAITSRGPPTGTAVA